MVRATLVLASVGVACVPTAPPWDGDPPARPLSAPAGPGAVAPPADPSSLPPLADDGLPRVVILSIDGLRADMVSDANTPLLWRLRTEGVYAPEAHTIVPSLTLPSHASMLSGQPQSVTKVDWNDIDERRIATPTVFSVARQAGLRTVMVVGKEKFASIVYPDSLDAFVYAPGGDAAVVDAAIREARRGFRLMFVHLPDVDLTGHGQGWLSEPYVRAARVADAAVGRLRAALFPSTTLIVTADHGGTSYGHGGDIPEHVRIPWIAHGGAARTPGAVDRVVSTMDTAATAAHILNLRLGPGALGVVVPLGGL